MPSPVFCCTKRSSKASFVASLTSLVIPGYVRHQILSQPKSYTTPDLPFGCRLVPMPLAAFTPFRAPQTLPRPALLPTTVAPSPGPAEGPRSPSPSSPATDCCPLHPTDSQVPSLDQQASWRADPKEARGHGTWELGHIRPH